MIFHAGRELTPALRESISGWSTRLPLLAHEQLPDFAAAAYPGASIRYCSVTENHELKAYAVVVEKKRLKASVTFGPVGVSEEAIRFLLEEMIRFYKRKLFAVLDIIPPHESTSPAVKIKSGIPSAFQWASLQVALPEQPDDLLASFSSHHRRAVRKAEKSGITVLPAANENEISEFANGYTQMYVSRNLSTSAKENETMFINLFRYFEKNNSGEFLLVKQENKIIGGVCMLYNSFAFYFKGYADPAKREIPVLHGAFYHAMLRAKERGLNIFDLGGYSLSPDEQLSSINHFKSGFGGTLIYHPAGQTIPLNAALYKLLRKTGKI
jgi:hypothetical protein